MAGRGIRGYLGITSLILIAGALLLMLFVVLSGVRDHTPLNKTYFLRADTSSIQGARPVSQWTYFYVCGENNADCGRPVPALPFGYAWVGGGQGAPASLLGSHGKNTTSTHYYYLWRFGWVFYLLALASTALTFLTSMLAPCSRLAAGVSGTLLAFSLFWFSLAAALMTAEFVQARNALRSAGIPASIGRYAFGFTWGAWAAMFLATIFLFLGCGAGRRDDDHVRATKTRSAGAGRMGSLGFFKRQRSRRSARGSFVDNESQRRVKEEY